MPSAHHRGAGAYAPLSPKRSRDYFRPPDALLGNEQRAQTAGAYEVDQSTPLGGRSKRALDLMIALPMIIVLLPVMIVISAMIYLTGGGSPVFCHQRVGYRGNFFPCYKFRTMVPNAQEALEKYLESDPEAAREWKKRQKLRFDPRVTRLGKILRKFSLDEFPQLFNVLTGEMSCVGPRPITMEELERYDTRADLYLSTRPGLTGLWQVNGRSSTDFAYRVAVDERYVRDWTLAGDFAILAKTPAAILRIAEAH